MLAWIAVGVGSVVVLLGLIGLIGNRRVRGLGPGIEPRRDGLGHLLLGAALTINAGLDLADSRQSTLLAVGTVSCVAGIIVLVQARMRAARATRAGDGSDRV